jgi:hypothetical protein
MERYAYEGGRYVLYVGRLRGRASERVALLIDPEAGCLITHGEPGSVRAELDALSAVDPQRTANWILLEGRPALGALNRAVRGQVELHDLHLSFTQASAQRLAGELIARLRQRRMT